MSMTSYVAHAYRHIGRAHQAEGRNCQDHAVARYADHGIVLAVADGISGVPGGGATALPSQNEVGAWLGAEVTAKAASDALARGVDIEDVIDSVGEALYQTLSPIWSTIGRSRGNYGLASTVMLAVITEHVTRIWLSGDGYWGVICPPRPPGSYRVDCHDVVLLHDGAFAGAVHAAGFSRTATTEARASAEAVTSQFRPVLTCHGPVLGVHIGTDGLRFEPDALALLQKGPVRQRAELEATFVRPGESDDLGIAWAATLVPGLLEGE